VRLRKLAIDGEKTLQGVAELAYDTLPDIGALESDRIP
jgi:hypothetical protein